MVNISPDQSVTSVTSKQPEGYRWLFWIGPPIVAISFVALEIATFQRHGRLDASTIQDWAFEVLFVTVLSIPLMVMVREVTARPDGLVAHFYVGPVRFIPWEDFELVGLFGARGRPDEANRVIRLVPKKGRGLTLTDRMTNFDALAARIVQMAKAEITLKPRVIDKLLWGATESTD